MQPGTCASCENNAFAFYVQSYADLFSLKTILYLKRREQMLIMRSKLILVSLEKFSKDNTLFAIKSNTTIRKELKL